MRSGAYPLSFPGQQQPQGRLNHFNLKIHPILMKLFLLSTLSAFLLPAALPAQSSDAPVDPFEGGPPISLGQQAAAVADASYRDGKDQIGALNDGKEPKTSADNSVPFFSFYPREGSFEWVQYGFPSAMALEGCEVFWKRSAAAARRPGPDKGTGLPLFWKVLYQNAGGDWLPVDGVPDPPSLDCWNVCRFKPVMTKALRLAVQQASGSSVGLYEWKVIPAQAKPVPAVPPGRTPAGRPHPPLREGGVWKLPGESIFGQRGGKGSPRAA